MQLKLDGGYEFAITSSRVLVILSSQIKTNGASLYAVLMENSSSIIRGKVFPVLRMHKSLEGLGCVQKTRERPLELLVAQSVV